VPEPRTILFADGVLEAHVTHGVARLTLAQAGPDGKPVPAGQLVVPLVQLPAFANGLMGLLRQVESRVKEAQGRAQPGPAVPGGGDGGGGEAAVPPAVPGAFRFGGD
jgi:hypothetical protein